MTDLETLLRASGLTHGRIQLYADGRKWSATIAHFDGHMSWEEGYEHDDPVDALRAALIEDERQCRQLQARYHAAPKMAATPPAATDDDFGDLLG